VFHGVEAMTELTQLDAYVPVIVPKEATAHKQRPTAPVGLTVQQWLSANEMSETATAGAHDHVSLDEESSIGCHVGAAEGTDVSLQT
jgi:hypothetical protein